MAASGYERDRKRIYVESENRSKGWKKKALQRLDEDYDATPIHRNGKFVGIAQGEGGGIICKKKSFKTCEAAEVSLGQIGAWVGGNLKPQRAYQCFHCDMWHLTHWEHKDAGFVKTE
jgi:hypothetical protein